MHAIYSIHAVSQVARLFAAAAAALVLLVLVVLLSPSRAARAAAVAVRPVCGVEGGEPTHEYSTGPTGSQVDSGPVSRGVEGTHAQPGTARALRRGDRYSTEQTTGTRYETVTPRLHVQGHHLTAPAVAQPFGESGSPSTPAEYLSPSARPTQPACGGSLKGTPHIRRGSTVGV